MSGFYCPVEECSKAEDQHDGPPPFEGPENLRGHISAMNDPEHRQALDERPWTTLEGSPESGDSEEEDEVEATSEQDPSEGGDEGGEESPEADDDQDMPTREEYDQQHKGQSQPPEEGDEGDDQDDQPVDDDSGGFSLPSLSGRTMMILVAVLALLVILFVVRSGDRPEEVTDADVTGDESDDGEAVSDEEVSLIE
ncbi:hypothetical protein [Haloarchaeobius sp. HME9146]|uniref:hypothetical protein n=1 Tax=Haloarchaeobius sp. HME9146 TaxID=2978732 RepID=UPI0021C0F625|nr:hypothetical protein [Haloarchaeobius sp. HME9146]MCT9095270.1 hypothetical protein [Haloarchaeobius sp. HME9146]